MKSLHKKTAAFFLSLITTLFSFAQTTSKEWLDKAEKLYDDKKYKEAMVIIKERKITVVFFSKRFMIFLFYKSKYPGGLIQYPLAGILKRNAETPFKCPVIGSFWQGIISIAVKHTAPNTNIGKGEQAAAVYIFYHQA